MPMFWRTWSWPAESCSRAKKLLGGLVSAQGFDRVAQAAVDGAGVGEKLGVFGGG